MCIRDRDWAACYSWTEYLHGRRGDGIFIPRVEKVLRKFVAGGLAKRGLQVHFSEVGPATETLPSLNRVKNYRKIWDPSIPLERVPDRFKTTESELLQHLHAELEHFAEQISTDLAELEANIKDTCEKAQSKTLTLDFTPIIPFYCQEPTPETLMIAELQHRCTHSREVLRKINKVNLFRAAVSAALEYSSTVNKLTLTKNILNTATRDLSEIELRDFLRKMDLPEHAFVFYNMYNSRKAICETSDEMRRLIAEQSSLWEKAHRYELRVRKLVPFNRQLCSTSIIFEPIGKILVKDTFVGHMPRYGPNFDLHISCHFPASRIRQLRRGLLAAGWEISEGDSWVPNYIRIDKLVRLSANDSFREIKEKMAKEIHPFALKIK